MTGSVAYRVDDAAPGAPLLGHALRIWKDPIGFFRELRDQGDVVVIRVGSKPAYVINHPDVLRQVLVNDAARYDKGAQLDKVRPLFGNGVATSSGAYHLRQRRMIEPAFHHQMLESYVDIMHRVVGERIATWQDGQTVAMESELHAISLIVVAKALFATDVGVDLVAEVQRSLPVILDGVTRRATAPFGIMEKLPTPYNIRLKRAVERLHSGVQRIIDDYRDRGIDHGDLLSRLLRARDEEDNGMTDQQLHDEVATILAVGSETTANTLSWACYLLASDPGCQRRVQEEVDAVLDGGLVTRDTVKKLDYVGRVMKEALRLYPASWLNSRRPTADVEIGGHPVPAGSQVFYSTEALHRDALYYEEPHRFDPDRWLPDRAKSIPRSAYVPFGAGVHACVGERFALAESAMFLANVASRWTMRYGADKQPVAMPKATLGPDRMPITLVPRDSR